MKKFVPALVLALSALPLAAARVEIVLDVSGSMRASAGNMSRMEAAQRAVNATIAAIDANSNVALRLYGHRLPSEPKAQSCRDTELVIPFGPLDRQRFTAAVQSAKPLGQTPLAFALEQAAADFGQIGDEPVAVILVSDGEESCGGDPAKVACAFKERGLELTVHTVGFDVGAAARQQLQSIATCTGGQYRDARNAGELSESLRQLTQAGLLLQKTRETRGGREVRGGNGFTSAVPITAGTYRLDHHQRYGDFDYFSIDLKPGQLIQVSQDTYDVGVTIEGNTFTQNEQPIAGVALHAPDQTRIGYRGEIGPGKKAVVGTAVAAGQGGKFYILIGHDQWQTWGIHKESPFTIQITDVTDAKSGTDAGSSDREAVKIAPGKHQGWFQPGDNKDVYGFDAVAGSTYNIVVRPDNEVHSLHLVVSDEDRVDLASVFAPNAGAVARLENVKPSRTGPHFVRLEFFAPPNAVPYSIEITEVVGAATAAGPTTTDTATGAAVEESESKKGFFSYIPGGKLTCAGFVVFVLLVIGGAIGLIVFLIKRSRRKKGAP